MKAAIYARYSTENQREASIDDQVRGCERLALRHGLEVVARFEDRGISGGTTERPGYQALLDAARAGQFTVILAEDLSRLWRNRAEFGSRSAELEDLGVHLVTCVGEDTRRDGWGLVVTIKSALAEHARREISYRTRRGMEGRALAGASTGGRTYGYASASTVDPAQAAVVRQAYVWYTEGLTAAKIATRLNQSALPAPRGGEWQPSTVAALLANERYTGAVRWGGTTRKGSAVDSRRSRRLARPESAIERRDDALTIVPTELWQAVAAERARRACALPPAVVTSAPLTTNHGV
jgi:DNA invertase Pin-like site-specific DNA recombinase